MALHLTTPPPPPATHYRFSVSVVLPGGAAHRSTWLTLTVLAPTN